VGLKYSLECVLHGLEIFIIVSTFNSSMISRILELKYGCKMAKSLNSRWIVFITCSNEILITILKNSPKSFSFFFFFTLAPEKTKHLKFHNIKSSLNFFSLIVILPLVLEIWVSQHSSQSRFVFVKSRPSFCDEL